MKIAVLGLGRMGQAIAGRLLDGGLDLTVWNRSADKADELVAGGATRAGSPEEAVAAADVVITSLSNDDAVRELALGSNGIRTTIGSRIYIDASTISPTLSAELGHSFDRFVALPISGAPSTVREGTATYLAGGPDDLIEELEPLWHSLGGQVKRYARPELASTGKLAVNLLLLAGIATLSEAVKVGRSGGLTDDELGTLLRDSPMLAPGLKNRFDAVLSGSGPTWWTTRLGTKDVDLAIRTAQAADKDLAVARTVRDLYQSAVDAGLDDEDIVAVARLDR
jgi:3-hydroxyisobutyrate dehydrogenase-like beta-hydroxyacid dehydrogenase